jgi:hypothetical protein
MGQLKRLAAADCDTNDAANGKIRLADDAQDSLVGSVSGTVRVPQ